MLVINEREAASNTTKQQKKNSNTQNRRKREKRTTSRASVAPSVIYELIIQIASWVCWRVNRLVSFASCSYRAGTVERTTKRLANRPSSHTYNNQPNPPPFLSTCPCRPSCDEWSRGHRSLVRLPSLFLSTRVLQHTCNDQLIGKREKTIGQALPDPMHLVTLYLDSLPVDCISSPFFDFVPRDVVF